MSISTLLIHVAGEESISDLMKERGGEKERWKVSGEAQGSAFQMDMREKEARLVSNGVEIIQYLKLKRQN